jgi:hypothetical protein
MSVGENLAHAITALVLAASWALAGFAILPARLRQAASGPLVWGTALALGAGLSATLLMAIAAAGALTRNAVIVVAAAEAVVAIVGARRALRAGAFTPSASLGREDTLMVAVLSMVLLLTLFVTLAPPSSMDATVYHLRVPREFLRSGSWAALEDPHSYQPLFVEMLFGEAMVLGGGVAAALVHWVLGIGAMLVAAAWGRRFQGKATWAAVIFAATGLFVWESTSAFIDLGLTLFSSLAIYWATRAERDGGAPVLAGVFAGLAAGSKFTGLVAAGLAALSAFAAVWPDKRRALSRTAIVGSVALLIASPWYLRNFAFTGNPIYPLTNHLWGLPPVSLATETYGYGRSLVHFLTSPFDLLARGGPFDQGWSVGPAVLGLAPLGLWVSRRARPAWIAAAVIAAWWLVWFVSSPQTRLLLPILPIAAGLASAGMRAATDSTRPLRWAAIAVVAVSTAGGAASAALYVRVTGKVVLGRETADQYLERNSWNYVAYEAANQLLPPNARVAAVGANNLYYLDRTARSFASVRPDAELAAAGFSHVLAIGKCGDVASAPGLLWSGRYPLIASRSRGGTYGSVCANLWSLTDRNH